jgi:hypothetical protein
MRSVYHGWPETSPPDTSTQQVDIKTKSQLRPHFLSPHKPTTPTDKASPETAFLVHLAPDALAIHILLGLNNHNIIVLLGRSAPAKGHTGSIIDDAEEPVLQAHVSVEPEVEAIRASGRCDTHPNKERMLTARRRDAIGEEKAGIGEAG